MSDTRQLHAWIAELGGVSDDADGLTRTFLSPAMVRANALVAQWMKEAGLTTRVDAIGNLIGRLESKNENRKPKTLLLGSHLDTVRHAGRYDGALGVLLGLAAVAELRRRGASLPFHVEVIGFSEEEGVRFASAYLGSKGYCGKLSAADLAGRDAAGVSVGDALQDFNRGKFSPPGPAHARRDLLGYVEAHIEQGPVLERERLAVGVVSAIAGQTRFKLTWTGKAGHAGTTPMALRRDAFAGAAEFALAAEKLARATRGLVATVGAVTVAPGAANVIPGRVEHTLDVRHAKDSVRRTALRKLDRLAAQIARRRGLAVRWVRTQDNAAVACDPALTRALARGVRAVQGKSPALVSGAGHDAVVMSALCPVAMLFVRCRDGLSHHPDEFAAPRDIDTALRVLVAFLEKLAADYADEHG